MKALYVDKEELVGHMTMIFTVSCLPLQVYMPENPVTPEAEQLILWTAFCCPLSLKANRIAYLSNVTRVPK